MTLGLVATIVVVPLNGVSAVSAAADCRADGCAEIMKKPRTES
jgi:hypothetical protein